MEKYNLPLLGSTGFYKETQENVLNWTFPEPRNTAMFEIHFYIYFITVNVAAVHLVYLLLPSYMETVTKCPVSATLLLFNSMAVTHHRALTTTGVKVLPPIRKHS